MRKDSFRSFMIFGFGFGLAGTILKPDFELIIMLTITALALVFDL